MKLINKITCPLVLCISFFFMCETLAQKAPDCIKTAKITRPTKVFFNIPKLNDFYKNYDEAANFKDMKIVKADSAYYLVAIEKSGTRLFAFELELKGKKLYLNKKLPVQTCSEGEFSLYPFIQENGKLTGCILGKHIIKQGQ